MQTWNNIARAHLAQGHLPVSMGALTTEEFIPYDKAVRGPKSKGVQVDQRYLSVTWGSSGQGFFMRKGRGTWPSILRFLMSPVVTRDLWFMETTVVKPARVI